MDISHIGKMQPVWYSLTMKKAYSKQYILVIVIVPFLGTRLAIALLWQRAVYWSDLPLLGAMYPLTAFGSTAGSHRMLTHRSFQATPVVTGILLALASMRV